MLRIYGIMALGMLPMVLFYLSMETLLKGLDPAVATLIIIGLALWFVFAITRMENDKIDYSSINRSWSKR